MKNIVKINKDLGWFLIIGIIITQIIITKITFDAGGMAPFIAFLTAILFFPFIIIAIVSVLNRERNLNKIKSGIIVGLFFQVALPTILPLLFDKELIYFSLLGIFLGGITWYFRKRLKYNY